MIRILIYAAAAYLAYLLYLVPALALYNILRDLLNQSELFITRIIVPAIPILIFVVMFIKLGTGALDHYDIGLYLSVLLGLLMLLNLFGLIGNLPKRR